MKNKFYLLILCICSLNMYVVPKAIIWDLGYTLIEHSSLRAVPHVGLLDGVVYYLMNLGDTSEITNALYGVMDLYASPENPEEITDQTPLDPKGNRPMPILMRKWLIGEKSSSEVLTILEELVKQYTGFHSLVHKRMVKSTMRMMFTPQALAEVHRPIASIVELLAECAAQVDDFGNPKHTLYILSNFDCDTFSIIRQMPEYESIFKHFNPENIYISGQHHEQKPAMSFYLRLLTERVLSPEECIFIDDQPENCRMAEQVGMTAYQVVEGNAAPIRGALVVSGVIKEVHDDL